MKALFLIYHGFQEYNGISKKIRYQIKALKECGIETHICYLTDQAYYKQRWIDDKVVCDYGNTLKAKIQKRTDFSSVVDFVKQNNISFIYVRHDHNASPFTIRLFQKLRKLGCIIVVEIPTYPYDEEYKGFPLSLKIDFYIDKLFRKKLMSYAEKIVTFSPSEKIFGKSTIRISNGVDFDDLPLNRNLHSTTTELNLVGIAEIHPWHGFDRLLKGMVEYYENDPEYKVYFHIVGHADEPYKNKLNDIIQKGHIEEYVYFHGRKHGKDLTSIIENADMGIGSLARHRSGISTIKTLKNREYAARGIPFIYSEIDEDFDNQPYIMKVPADESPISILNIIHFFHSKQWIPEEIRNSIQHLSWNKQMQKIINEI